MGYSKKLEGICRSKDVDELLDECLDLIGDSGAKAELTKEQAESMLNDFGRVWSKTISTSPPSPANNAQDQASLVLQAYHEKLKSEDMKWIPISVIKAAGECFDKNGKHERSRLLNKALSKSTLVFTPPPEETGKSHERLKFKLRMERLRLMDEETQYGKITKNIGTERPDDVTTKSMTYAASVGLNMIVAPLSFGCFMYFFAGSLLDWILGRDEETKTTGGTDIKRVIIGVVSGVVMLFIEMILFVIRTHEFEKYTQIKEKKNKRKPFGHYSKKEIMNRTYRSDQGVPATLDKKDK